MKQRITWLSLLQGFAMLLVVIGHAWLVKFDDPDRPVVTWLIKWIYSFHMPLFFAVSGYLFWATRIVKSQSFGWVVLDKIKRLLVPYCVFTVVAFVLKAKLPGLVDRKVETDLSSMLTYFVKPSENPLRELWFIGALFWMFVPVSLYRTLQRSNYQLFCLLLVSIFGALFFPPWFDYFALSFAFFYFPYFVLGMVLAKNELLLNSVWLLWLSVLFVLFVEVYRAMHTVISPLIGATAWIVFLFCCSPIISNRFPGLFGSFRERTFQIFLLGIFFQIGLRAIYHKFECCYYVFFVLSVAFGLYGPVLVALVVARLPKPVRLLIGL